MSSSTLGTETLSRGGCCCRRASQAPSNVGQATRHSENWGAKDRYHSAAPSRLARAGCRFVPSFMLLASASPGALRSAPFGVVFAAPWTSHGREAIARLLSRLSAQAPAVFQRSERSTLCRTRRTRLIMMERSGWSDFVVLANHASGCFVFSLVNPNCVYLVSFVVPNPTRHIPPLRGFGFFGYVCLYTFHSYGVAWFPTPAFIEQCSCRKSIWLP